MTRVQTGYAAQNEEGPLEIRLLGVMQAYRRGKPLNLGGTRQRSVLAVLLLHPGRTVPKQQLIERAWRDDPPRTAEDLVTSYLSRLRRVLSPDGDGIVLLATRPGFRAELDPAIVDAHQFTDLMRQAEREQQAREDELAAVHLQSALDLWRGNTSALIDLMESDWLRAQAETYEQRRLEALERLASLHLDANRPALAAALLRDVAPVHPERESLTVTLIRALTASGEAVQAAQLAARTADRLIDLGQDPGPALRKAQTAALAHRPDTPAATEQAPRRQLPAATRAFTGREAELRWLFDTVAAASRDQDPGKSVICAIDGMAGVGKSALAVHFAHRLADRYPDGQLFIDLHGHTQGYAPRTAAEALDACLRALGVPHQQIPQDLEERAAFYRERLQGTKTLILLDNANSEAQVRPLLPASADCLVLITSRKRLRALDDAHSLSLDPLPTADAVALVRTVAGPGRIPANDTATDEIVSLCGQLPLALRIAAALLRHRSSWSPAYLSSLLRDRHNRIAELTDGERDLTAVFDLSYDGLPAAQQQLFRRLGLLPGTEIDAYAAAALLDTDLRTATRLLEDLVDHHLLAQPTPGRYRQHDLVRIHARTRADDDDADVRDKAIDRLLDFYLATTRAANRHLARRTAAYEPAIAHPPRLQPALDDRDQAATWMLTNLSDLAASIDFAAAADGRPGYVIAMSAAMHGYLYIDGPWNYALRLHETAANVAHQLGDQQGQATALHSLGRVRRLTGDYPGAMTVHHQALDLYRAINHRRGQANALDSIGRIRWLTSDYKSAIDAFEQALPLFREEGDPLGQAGTLNGIGRVRRLTGDFRAAIEAHEQALDLCIQANDRIGEATALNDLGRAHYHRGDYQSAANAQERALRLYRTVGHRMGQANALNDLGRISFKSADFPGARKLHESALALYRDMGSRRGLAETHSELGRVRLQTADLDAAATHLDIALRLFREVGDRQGEAESLNRRAAVLAAQSASHRPHPHTHTHANVQATAVTHTYAHADAHALHTEALHLAQEINSPIDEAEALEGLAEISLAEGRTEQAIEHLRKSLAIYGRLEAPDIRRISARLADLNHAA